MALAPVNTASPRPGLASGADLGPTPHSDRALLGVVAFHGAAFVALGLAVGPLDALLPGLGAILTARDTLITDYFGIGGMGPAFLNAGLLTLLACLCFLATGARVGGAALAALFLLLGFGLFGKNLLNCWPIVAGVLLYARLRREPLGDHLTAAFFACALAPVFSEVLFSSGLHWTVSLPLALVVGLTVGFCLPPVAAQLFKVHQGFNLYNMGFAAGVLGTVLVSLFVSFGLVPEPVSVWTRGNDGLLGTALALVFLGQILAGLALDRGALRGLKAILGESGQAPSDFLARAGLGAVLVNMGLCGLMGLGYLLLIGGDLNGPTIAGIFTIVGFAAFGKHAGNIWPPMLGIWLASLLKPLEAADPGFLLAALFGTTLAPIAGRFGWHWGIAAGFLHSSVALATSVSHGGLNLYNNGFAAGMVAAVLVPVILALRPGPAPGEGRSPD